MRSARVLLVAAGAQSVPALSIEESKRRYRASSGCLTDEYFGSGERQRQAAADISAEIQPN